MVASKNTVVNVYNVLAKHLSDDAITELLTELTNVKGNASFVQTIELLATQHNNNKATLDDDS